MDRVILHCDLNGFYASVELLYRPDLLNRPVAVCGDPEKRHGVILAKNEPARKAGVKTAETVWQAQRKCPSLVLIPPHHDWYEHFSQEVNRIYRRFTDLVEPFGIDESWLDVTNSLHLFGGDGRQLADEIRAAVRNELGLTISVGVSFNKIFAKLGSDYQKPDATTVISRADWQALVHPLPVNNMLYVGKVAAAALARIGVRTIGQLAALSHEAAEQLLGKTGELVHDYANGRDEEPVTAVNPDDPGKSIGSGQTFSRNLAGLAEISSAVSFLSDRVGTQLRHQNAYCQAVQVVIKRPDLTCISRQKQLPAPTCSTKRIAEQALEIITTAWDLNQPIRMLTVTALGITNSATAVEPRQLSFFEPETEADNRTAALEATVDELRGRFGRSAVIPGGSLLPDLGLQERKQAEKLPW